MSGTKSVYTTSSKQWASLPTPVRQESAQGKVFEKVGPAAVLRITDEETHNWKGFGGCFNELGWDAMKALPAADKDAVFQSLFGEDGCRFTFCRMPIGASDYALEWYSLNETDGDYAMKNFSIERDRKYLIPFIKEAQKYVPDMKMFASPWSPPTWMKYPKAHNFGTLIQTDENLKAYALYFLAFIEAYEKEGIKISQIHVQNEPVSSQKFPSCIWTGEEFARFIGKYLGPLFKEKGLDVDIWLGTLNGPETDARKWHTTHNHYAQLVLSDPEAYPYIKGVSYQYAGKYAIAQTRAAWPEMELMQSENECGDSTNTWRHAEYVYDLMHHYISNGASSYIYWNMILEEGGSSTWGWKQNAMINVVDKTKVVLNPEFYVMKHFAAFIRPNDKVVRLEGPWCANTLCFRRDNEHVLLVRNPFKTKQEMRVVCNDKLYTVTLEPEAIHTIVLDK
jgi:glucosylceramidase